MAALSRSCCNGMAAGVPPFRPIAKRFRGRSQRSHGIRMSGGQRISALAPETAGPEGRRDLVLAYAAMNGRSSTWLFHEAVPRMWRPMRSDGVLGRGRAALYVLHEFVVMPDHLHLLLTPAPEVSLERAVQINQGRFFLSAWKRKTRIGLAGKLHKPSDSRRAGLYALRGVHSHESGPCAAGGNPTVV